MSSKGYHRGPAGTELPTLQIRVSMLRTVAVVLIAGLAAGSTSLRAQGREDPSRHFEDRSRDAEARLVALDTISMDFEVTAEGAVAVSLEGSLRRAGDRDLELRATGSFAGQEVDLHLTVDGETMTWGNGAASSEGPVPAELWRALAVGLTRMGILHNLARLFGGAPPDHADGGVGEWVTVHDFRPARGLSLFPVAGFDITVAGEPSGSAELFFLHGLPVGRLQTVNFPQGDMRVGESYWVRTVGPGEGR